MWPCFILLVFVLWFAHILVNLPVLFGNLLVEQPIQFPLLLREEASALALASLSSPPLGLCCLSAQHRFAFISLWITKALLFSFWVLSFAGLHEGSF